MPSKLQQVRSLLDRLDDAVSLLEEGNGPDTSAQDWKDVHARLTEARASYGAEGSGQQKADWMIESVDMALVIATKHNPGGPTVGDTDVDTDMSN